MGQTSNPTDLEARTNLCRKTSLRPAQNDVDELLAGGHRLDLKVSVSISGTNTGVVILYLLPCGLHLERCPTL